MQRLARVLFHVDAGQADELVAKGRWQGDAPAERERLLILRDLIALGQVGIEVILPGKDRELIDVKPEGERGTGTKLNHATIQNWQRTREPEADRTGVFVGLVTESR